MKRFVLAALALVFVIGLQPQAARAQDANASWNQFLSWLSHGQDPRLAEAGIGVGIGTGIASYIMTEKHHGVHHVTQAAAYGATTAVCAVLYPMVATVMLNRPLTPREAYTGIADCVVPFIGGYLVDKILPHDAWTDGLPAKPVHHHG